MTKLFTLTGAPALTLAAPVTDDVTLSPSGTVYAVYDTYRDSHQASGVANMLQGNHPEWHVRAVLLGPGDRCAVQWAHRR